VQTVAQLRVAGRKVSLSHFPYGGDHSGTDRFDEWRLRPSSTPLLCGHVHQAWVYNSNQFNVGQDFNPSLVTQDQVEAWIEGARPVTSGHIRRRIRALGETA
jgi:calcineurin-like phosphoesterase family protein